MITLQIIPDRFREAEKKELATHGSSSATRDNHVRRMTRGIVLQEDTFATLRLVAGDGKGQLIVDAGSNRTDSNRAPLVIGEKRATDIYSNFLLQQVQEERVEKQQIVETFGDPYIFLFGERARVISFTGILANTFDFNWEAEWWYNYDNYLRGTKAVEMDARVFLSFDNTLVGGYIISSAATKMSQERNWVQFQFQLFVTSYANFSNIGNPDATPVGEAGRFARNGDLGLVEAMGDLLFRPNLQIDPPRSLGVNPNGTIKTDELDAFAAGVLANPLVAGLANLWSSASQIADSIVSTASGILNGELVRVPVGFAGAMEFDSDPLVVLKPVNVGGLIKYTTFSDNRDEYVGSSDHYGTSTVGLLSVDFGDPNSKDALTYDQHLVDTAMKAWDKAGLIPPPEQLGPLSKLIVKGAVGLLSVGAMKAWTATSQAFNPDGVGPLGSSQTGSTPATASVDDIPPPLPE